MTSEPMPEGTDNKEPDAEAGADEPTFAPSETAPEPVLDTSEAAAAAEAPPAPGAEPAAPEVEPAQPVADLASRVAVLEAETADLNDKLLRALAETENVRRRAQRDKEDASKYAIKSFAEDLLRVSDNMGRALAAIDADARAQDANLEILAVGVEMVAKELLSAFERAGLKPIEAMGQRFDPMLHEAMFEIPDPAQPAGTVTQVLEDGYTLHGRTLRAAKVGVTKGGPKPDAKPVAGPGDEAGDASGDGPAVKDGRQAYEQSGEPGSAGGTGGQVDEKL